MLANHAGVSVRHGDVPTAYRAWSATYDEPRNALFDVDEPTMLEILDALPAGACLDAACGTGRYAGHMAARGHRVFGVDASPDMLRFARVNTRDGPFAVGDVDRLPVQRRRLDGVAVVAHAQPPRRDTRRLRHSDHDHLALPARQCRTADRVEQPAGAMLRQSRDGVPLCRCRLNRRRRCGSASRSSRCWRDRTVDGRAVVVLGIARRDLGVCHGRRRSTVSERSA